MSSTEVNDPTCSICLATLREEADGPNVAFRCIHTFHAYCVNSLMDAEGCTNVSELRCPVCKLPNTESVVVEASPVASPHIGDTFDDRDGTTTHAEETETVAEEGVPIEQEQGPEAEKPEEPAAKSKGKGKSKAKSNAACKAKSKAACKAVVVEAGVGSQSASPSSHAANPVLALDRPTMPTPSLFCGTCGNVAEPLRCRIMSKVKGIYRCNKCHSKVTALYRTFGAWPLPGWEDVPEDTQKAFFAGDHGNANEMKKHVNDLLQKFETKEQFWENGGQFLPLSVWERQGFDPEKIREGSSKYDRQCHPVLGETFRVALMSCGDRGTSGERREQFLQKKIAAKFAKKVSQLQPLAASGSGASSSGAVVDAFNMEHGGGQDSDTDSSIDDSSSSSSSTDSSESRKKRKRKKSKGKKDKKKSKKANKDKKKGSKRVVPETPLERKLREKLDKEQARLAMKRQNARKLQAQQIINKIAATLTSVEALTTNPIVKELPEMVTQQSDQVGV